jgi:hypothetical protein
VKERCWRCMGLGRPLRRQTKRLCKDHCSPGHNGIQECMLFTMQLVLWRLIPIDSTQHQSNATKTSCQASLRLVLLLEPGKVCLFASGVVLGYRSSTPSSPSERKESGVIRPDCTTSRMYSSHPPGYGYRSKTSVEVTTVALFGVFDSIPPY